MVSSFDAAMKVAGSGLDAQTNRLRIVSENIANAQSTSKVSGGDPYQRKVISFSSELDRASGASLMTSNSIDRDTSAFPTKFDPASVAADSSGYVKMPNVNILLEMADMREANRSYEANLQVIKQVKSMVAMTVELLRPS